MGRRSITGGVIPANGRRIQFDFAIEGVRYRPTLRWEPTEANLRRAREHLRRIKARIAAGTFNFAEEFPDFRRLHELPLTLRAQTCAEVFDAFLRHEERRVAKGDLAPATLASHRQSLNHVWCPAIGRLPFLGVRYSTLVKVADGHSWKKKTYNNAISALRRAFEFGYRDYPEKRDPAAAPIRRLYTPYSHWRTTLRRLPIRYRKPYAARHSSVSWDLMIGRNPLWVAKQHGHSLLTMLRVYAAWTADAPETDAVAIQDASGYVNRSRDPHGTSGFPNRLAVDLPVANGGIGPSAGKSHKIDGGEGGIRTRRGLGGSITC
jgi:hypothetical protein